MFSHYSLRKQLKRVPRFSRLTVQQFATLLHFWRHRFNMAKVFQIWSTVAGYDELYACDFSQSETEKYFEWIINCNKYYFVTYTTVQLVTSGPLISSHLYGWSITKGNSRKSFPVISVKLTCIKQSPLWLQSPFPRSQRLLMSLPPLNNNFQLRDVILTAADHRTFHIL